MPEKPQIEHAKICERCHGNLQTGFWRCAACHGYGIGYGARSSWLYWDLPLTVYAVTLARWRRYLEVVRSSMALFLAATSILVAGFLLYTSRVWEGILSAPQNAGWLLSNAPQSAKFLFWFALLMVAYAWYRSIVFQLSTSRVERRGYDTDGPAALAPESIAEAIKNRRAKKIAITKTYTPDAIATVTEGLLIAVKSGAEAYEPIHVFRALLNNRRVANIFVRLGISAERVQKELTALDKPRQRSAVSVQPSQATYDSFFLAYETAYELHQDSVNVTELLEAVVSLSPLLQDLLFALDVDKQKLINVVAWSRNRDNLYRRYIAFKHAAGRRDTKGMDRAMTALATPFLNQFSEDITLAAQFGRTQSCVARDGELESIFRIIEGGGKSVLLVGESGTGRRSIIEGVAERMVTGDVPRRLYDKRLVRLSTSALLAGTSPAGAVERVQYVMAEIARAGNVILFINNIHELVGVSAGAGGSESLDVGGAIAEHLASGAYVTLATCTTEAFNHSIANSALSNVFTRVDVREMDENQAIQVVESKVGGVEYKHRVYFAYTAVEKAVQFAKRYLHDSVLPGSAEELVTEAASYARAHKGADSLVSEEDVAVVVAEKTKIPVTSVTADETSKLLSLEKAMHERVVGQDEAVSLVANALRRARAEVRAQTRPIANFLFLGPTGVGKTELAKTIAEIYFGGEERMTRLDMSEYQDTSSIYRLIGTPGEKGSGVLTETIRHNPFTLLLLDEIEKADKDILNVFLQVMDDGRLTDSTGRVVDFTNVIIIATSNAGTEYVGEQLRKGLATDAIKDRLLHGELKQYFRPEFLNRFDGIVLFKPLSRDDIKQVAARMLNRVGKDLEVKGITLQVEPAALEFLANAGFDPEFGARPMRRAIEERVENKLAEMLLSGKLKRHDAIVMGENGEIKRI